MPNLVYHSRGLMQRKVRPRVLALLLAAGLPMMASGPTYAKELRVGPPIVLNPVVQRWMRFAGLIFRGTVTSIGPATSPLAGSPAVVEVTFHVDYGVRGVRSGAKLTVREWAGPWLTHPRYRVGERVFTVLYQPNAAGITSEVAGTGALRVNRFGNVAVPTAWLIDSDNEGEDSTATQGPLAPGTRLVGTTALVRQIRARPQPNQPVQP